MSDNTRHNGTTQRLYHGTRAELKPGDLIRPETDPDAGARANPGVYLTSDLDAAIWEAELADGEGPGRVYEVEPTGGMEDVSDVSDQKRPGHPRMSLMCREPLRVTSEVTEWLHYHGTGAQLKPGDMLGPGHSPNFGDPKRTTNYIYFTRTLDAASWGAELAVGDGPGRIYIVEPTGPIEDDPNLTDMKFRGNPTKSFRSRHPLRITGEITQWKGHPPEAIAAMREGIERMREQGIEPEDD